MRSNPPRKLGFYRTATSENKSETRPKEQESEGTPLTNVIPRPSTTKIGAQRKLMERLNNPDNSNTTAVFVADPFLMLRRRERDPVDTDSSSAEENQITYNLNSESSEIEVNDPDAIIRAPAPEYFKDPDKIINEKPENNNSSSGMPHPSDDSSSLSSNAEIGESGVTPITLSEGPPRGGHLKRMAYSSSRNTPAARRQQLLKKTTADGEQPIPISDAEPLPKSESSSSTTETDRDQTTPPSSTRLGELISPKRKSKKAELGRLLSPRTLIQEAKETKAAKKAEKAKEAKLQSIRDNLPAGVKLDDDGNLTGTTEITHTPKECQPKHYFSVTKQLNKSYQEIFQGVAHTNMAKTLVKAGHTLAEQAAIGDLARHDFEFGSFRVMDIDPRLQLNQRVDIAAQSLFQFSGSDKATFVLSSLLHQGSPTMLQLSLINAKGTSLGSQLRSIPKGDVTSGRKLAILKGDGTRQPLPTNLNAEGEERQDIGGMSSCKFNLSHHGDDFKLSLGWDTYYERQRDLDGNLADGLPLGADDVIAVHFETELIIDGAMARKGEMQLTTEGIRATFSGRLDMSIN